MRKTFKICHQPTDNDLREMITLDKKVFNASDCMSYDKVKTFYQLNPEIYTVIKFNDKVIGYINFTGITKECYFSFCNGNNKDYLLSIKDIAPFIQGENYGIITSIVLEKDFRDGKAIKLLTNAFKHKIKILEKSGKYFFGLVCDCVSIDGIKYVINNFNGKYLCNSDYCGKIYKCDFNKNTRKLPKIKLETLSKINLRTASKIQYNIFNESKSIGYSDYKLEVSKTKTNKKDLPLDFLIKYRGKAVGVIGLFNYENNSNDIWLNWFGVLPKYRNKGIGTSALLSIIAIARKYNKSNFRLFTYGIWNSLARNIYNKTMQIKENYTNENDKYALSIYGKVNTYGCSLKDKVCTKWNNKYLNLNEEVALSDNSMKDLINDLLIKKHIKLN